MAEGINVRLSGPLKEFVETRSGQNGLYHSVSEYVRDLVRKDYEREEARKWDALYNELEAGINASPEEFIDFDPEAILAEAKQRNKS